MSDDKSLPGQGQYTHRYSERAGAQQAHLRILETSDLHAHIFPYDYFAAKADPNVGLGRIALLVERARHSAPNTLLFDNGDFLQGTPLGDFIAEGALADVARPHPVIAAMNALGYDAGTVGNHEFNFGLDFLLSALKDADFPLLSANAIRKMGKRPAEDVTYFPPVAILERTLSSGSGEMLPIRVGLIGFLPPQTSRWDRAKLAGQLDTRDIVETARDYAPELKAQGADLIVALAHSGLGAAEPAKDQENACLPLAALPEIDVVLAGHSHLVFPSPRFAGIPGIDVENGWINGKPATMPGAWGTHLGVVDLLLGRENGNWTVLDSQGSTQPLSDLPGDQDPAASADTRILAAAEKAHKQAISLIEKPIGETPIALQTYFATLPSNNALAVIAGAKAAHVKEALRDSEVKDLPVLSSATPFKSGGRGGPDYYTDIAAGPLAIRNAADLYIYPNDIRAVRICGSELRGWLERAASIFNQVTPGAQDARLLDRDAPGYIFDVMFGLDYEIDISAEPLFLRDGERTGGKGRIKNLRFEGRPVTDDMEFLVATNSYRISGVDGFPGANEESLVYSAPVTVRDLVINHIGRGGAKDALIPSPWRFTPLPGTSLLFETGWGSRARRPDIVGLSVEDRGSETPGYATYRLTFPAAEG
ncbi:MAG: bifunctional 2',3'-cyclic-nucleotide 2'-phosphodiesterase/3'-nucleotidase [Pseudomonadota bacterium]